MVFLVKPERKEQLGRRKRRWERNIKMGLKEIGPGGCGMDSFVL
jgi:hypothetical protein